VSCPDNVVKEIDVKNQEYLGFAKTFRIAVTGVKYRLFRAIVTVAVISVAMAFLMNILAESLIKKQVAETAQDQIASLRRVDRWIARLSIPQSPEEIIMQAAASDDTANIMENLRLLGQLDAPDTRKLEELSKSAAAFLTFFSDLNYGRRRVLVGSAEATRIFNRLQDDESREAFAFRLSDMKTVRFISTTEEFNAFLTSWPELRGLIDRVRNGQAAAIQTIQQNLQGLSLLDALRDANGKFGMVIRNAGFSLPEDEAEKLSAQVVDIADSTLIEEALNHENIRKAVAAQHDIMPGDVTPSLLWDMIKSKTDAAWYLEQMRQQNFNVGQWDAATITQLADYRARSFLLKQAERATMDSGGGLMGIGKRMTWLALVSMLVCAVGIANAMLMSVTERFREIATLKCLGALDGFIMTVFLIEASILGLVGGLAGTILGLFISIIRMFVFFKGLLLDAFPFAALMSASMLSIIIGVVLAAISAVYPSFRAARLAPMEAMRIE